MENTEKTTINTENETSNNETNAEVIKLAEPNYPEEITNLKNQIETLQDKLLRTMAESENTRRRSEKMVEETRDYSIFNFAKDLLGVMDNLSRALEYKGHDNENQSSIIAGVDMTKNELESIFKKYGIESIEPLPGEKFNYNSHHAVSQIVTDEYNEDSIVSTMQIGYKIKDRLLRPAVVAVSKKGS